MRRPRHQASWPGRDDATGSPRRRQVRYASPDPVPHRLLRLITAAGGALTGISAVAGLTTLAVTLGAHPQAAAPPARQGGTRASQGSAGSPGSEVTAGQSHAVFGGQGGPAPQVIPLREPDTWGLAWTFRCPNGERGSFTVRESGRQAGGRLGAAQVAITSSGTHGAGVWWDVRDPGVHVLRVQSGCPWHAHIVLPWAGAAPGPSASPSPAARSGGSPQPSHSPHPSYSPRPSPSPSPSHSHGHSPHPSPSPHPSHSHSPHPSHSPHSLAVA